MTFNSEFLLFKKKTRSKSLNLIFLRRGSEERLIEERELRDEKREKTKLKKYNKNMKQLRMEMRSSLYDRTTKAPHAHEYGEETYHEDEDNYTHACTICGFVETYEKM